MRKLTIALSLFAALLSQQSLAQSSDPVVMTVAGVDVPRSEFEYSFNKNNGDDVVEKKTVEEYAELYANYKLKVQAALDAKLDTMTSFQQEYAMYRDQQVRPTIVTDAEILATARKMYERTKKAIGPRGLVRPAHILLELSTQATTQEQEKARQRIDSAYRALQAGADFAELAKKISQDPVSSKDGGLLPWFGPGQTLKEFEDVAYSLQPGQMSSPFLSPIGYHIILMKERKQLEPFDSLKNDLLTVLERREMREDIISNKLRQMVKASNGTLTQDQILEKRSDSLAATDPEMKYLFQEYHDGLLLYEISSREVWEKATENEATLKAWFDAHRKDYTWSQPRYKGIAYHVKDKKDVKAVKNCVKRLPFDQWAEALRTTFNPDSVIRIRVEKGLFKPGDNATVDRMVFKVPAEVKPLQDYPIDAVYGKKLKKPSDYTDVRAQVVEDYQNDLERRWVASLRKRYPVVIHEEVLKTVNKHQ
ncbi:peptidyl-prolyl cis-trans isomerase D [Prevotella sp. ne3005]|uniref:peptidylprolyl isomerase n=1 Tax=Prevotella sp. ne3005 TaxID=1761887 RepID=UPI0008B5A679|nr:peptidylprolyl isomerase [Prevotella sp. ne3005]SEM57329.1 peptidyl-prolyl cis-trans isomerase D [Prevotella sp. ne3005]